MRRAICLVLLMTPLIHPDSLAGSLNEDAISWYNSGNDAFVIGHYSKAIEYYQQAVTLDDQYVEAWSNMGTAYRQLGEYDQAIEILDKALSINPQDSIAWNNKGLVYTDQDRYDDALFCFEMALKVNYMQKESWVNKGVCLINLNRLAEAEKALNYALGMDAEYGLAMYNLAILAVRKGDTVGMLDWLGKAIAEKSHNAKDARDDKDFSAYWEDPQFQELVSAK